MGKGRPEEVCITFLKGLKKEPTFMQKIKLNEPFLSPIPLITPIRAHKQHADRGEGNEDLKHAQKRH